MERMLILFLDTVEFVFLLQKGTLSLFLSYSNISLLQLRSSFPRIQGTSICLCPQTKYHSYSVIIVINGICIILPGKPMRPKNESLRK